MRVVLQRVLEAQVLVDKAVVGHIKQGLLVLLGIQATDTEADIAWITNKIANLRIFADVNHAMNLSLLDIGGNILLVSQFTLYSASKKGNRPSFTQAASPAIAQPLYLKTIETFNAILPHTIATGIFGADMQVTLCNDGPVTIILDTDHKDIF